MLWGPPAVVLVTELDRADASVLVGSTELRLQAFRLTTRAATQLKTSKVFMELLLVCLLIG
ncbi:hypothetical protein GCM10028825_22800 [Spirosoma agri]